MLIVNQNKDKTTESLELEIDCNSIETGAFPCTTFKIVSYYILDRKNDIDLGTYKTKDRAKEVLQEIYRSKQQKLPVYEMPEE